MRGSISGTAVPVRHQMRTPVRVRRNAMRAAAIVLALGSLTACSAPSAPIDTSPPGTSDTVETPGLVADGDAAANRPWFDAVNRSTLAETRMPGGQVIVDALVAAGFDKAAIEVTADRTPDGHAADAVQFSVQIHGECLIGQASPAGYSSTQAAALATGTCLLGATRPIDW